ncbi:MAG: hypothetical protein LKE89_03185 [Lactobacillaceae bacterium]|jgi:hypothetical protein|nr:hypothetical protein [Lactobacillaceae bacterium]
MIAKVAIVTNPDPVNKAACQSVALKNGPYNFTNVSTLETFFHISFIIADISKKIYGKLMFLLKILVEIKHRLSAESECDKR